jgi:hypothetical protein
MFCVEKKAPEFVALIKKKQTLIFLLGTVLTIPITLPVQAITLNWTMLGDVNEINSQTFELSTDADLDDDIDLGVPSGTFNFSGTPASDNSFGDLENFLGLPSGALDLGGEALEGSSVISTSFNVQAGDILSFDYRFLTNETADILTTNGRGLLNDYAFIALNDEVIKLADVGDANLDSDFFDQETGLQSYNRQFSQAGNISLALGVLDIDDFAITSGLEVENLTISSSPNPQSVPESNSILGLITFFGLGLLVVKQS